MNNLIKKNFFDNNEKLIRIQFIIIVSGISLRLFHYIYNRSLWLDECYLTSGLLHMNYMDLATKVLDYQQKAPIGFLWLVKLSMNLFGNQEMVLRMIPLIAGIISLFLYSRICSYFLKPWAHIIALSIFSFAPALIYHSVEIKQYSMECLATVAALYLFIAFKDQPEWKAKIYWGIFGGLLIWFSYSVIFVLAGIAGGMSIHYLLKKNWKTFSTNLLPFLMWLASFLINFLLFTHKHADTDWVVYFFKTYDNFMPFPPHSLHELTWFPRNFMSMLDYPLGLRWDLKELTSNFMASILAVPILPIILFFTGIYTLFIHHRRNFYILILPVLLMLVASGLNLYPLVERFWVFIAPIFILFIAMGFEHYQYKLKSDKILWAIFSLLIAGPIIQSVNFLIYPEKFYKHKKSFERESLLYINNNFQPGDAVYNYWNNSPGYQVYKNLQNFKYHAIEGRDFRKESVSLNDYNQHLEKDFKHFSNHKRVWLVFNNLYLTDIGDKADDPQWYYKNQLSPNNNLLKEMNKFGHPLKRMITKDVTIYLFGLN